MLICCSSLLITPFILLSRLTCTCSTITATSFILLLGSTIFPTLTSTSQHNIYLHCYLRLNHQISISSQAYTGFRLRVMERQQYKNDNYDHGIFIVIHIIKGNFYFFLCYLLQNHSLYSDVAYCILI